MPKTRNNPRFRIDTRSEKKADQTCFILLFQAQTPQQRRANNTFAKAEERKRGKPQGEVLRKEKPAKAPISKTWVYVLLFVVCGGLIVELLRIIFG
ncbi:hypothetical protein KC318_g12620 [Hortaea werneckii]|nr:hypothetical protein KC334_g12813 [Hortaea werneckii]KAI7002114.1 hypothetical protein KC355_g10033 [Hortaea werneckii]KAI7656109.1 hypothetical protein KC318_g12620 [Hortaea werneckii]